METWLVFIVIAFAVLNVVIKISTEIRRGEFRTEYGERLSEIQGREHRVVSRVEETIAAARADTSPINVGLPGLMEASEERAHEMQSRLRELDERLARRTAELDRLETEFRLEREEVDAVVTALRSELERQGRSTFWMGLGQNALFFVLGVVASVALN